jgi:exosortase
LEFMSIPSATPPAAGRSPRPEWIAFILVLAVAAGFFGLVPRFGPAREHSAIGVWMSAWNQENDFEHGWLFPPLVLALLYLRRREIAAASGPGGWAGLVPALGAAALFVLAYRALQWRVAIIGLPFLLTGTVWYLWGRRAAWWAAFPFCLTWLAIPVGFLQQATSGLQLIASKLGHAGAALVGVQTTLRGNILTMGSGTGFAVDEGCSGIRSLWALMLIAAAWTYLARMPLWKRVLLFLSAFPIAILGNALRLVSIFVLAEYGDATFAAGTWHDWSSLVLFYPISLGLLLAVHSVLEGGLPWHRGQGRELRRVVVTASTGETPP